MAAAFRNGTAESSILTSRFRVLAITPFERPDLPLARALWKQDVAVAIDIGRDASRWPSLFASLQLERGVAPGLLGVRIPDGIAPASVEFCAPLPDTVRFLIAAGDTGKLPQAWRHLPVLAQVCSLADAQRALDAGVSGLIAKGQESGGCVGDESSFILLQRLLDLAQRQAGPDGAALPVWCQGGIGLHTAAGAIAGGAYGVVLDSILACYPECSSLSATAKSRLLAVEATPLAGTSAEEAALPVGQDAALAGIAMGECPNIEALINGLRMRMAGQLHQAQNLQPLQEGSAWACAHGVRYPVAQGPMTRVSDTPAFAAAVAKAGGLPFLALALMQKTAARELLEQTRSALGERPWGVGVLGFATPEILEPQLDLVREFRPSVLLLAGGRPSQARPFVEVGIPVYLHVPSPALLDDFLRDGMTHFIFEGRECGGHVGPRYSFVLWEQMLAVLEKAEAPEKLHLLFAGGIHDERSAAMVAAIAAPLAARGARIGVLMGTAYIATQEAVACGAIVDDFQQRALAGEQTVLVETGPGHAVRCLPSGFVEAFEREKRQLQLRGVAPQEASLALEALTVGRLRAATKGLDYVDGALTSVDAAHRQAEGLYMIGQAIAMKQAVTTVAALHEQVTSGATRHLAAVRLPPLPRARNAEPIAVIGMACIYPGAPHLEAYWGNILEGRDLVREVPAHRWSAEQYYRADAAVPGKTISKWGGFIDAVPFDPLQYGIPPQSLAAIEPVQLLSLEVAARAIRDAGYDETSGRWFDRQRAAVIFGAEAAMDLANQYTFRSLYPQYCGELPDALAQALPDLTEDSFPGILANVIAGRVANRLGLHGVNYTVDAACASSLAAVELAVKELRGGSSDLVLAGGADFHNGIVDFLMFSSVGALSPTGRCRAFDSEADGICLGEGVGIVVLKRLVDAERDGDRIYAVIDGIAGSSDGRALGLTAPNKEGQKRALERTYWQAGVLPAEVGLVEAHGTGTVVGDRTELKALSEVFNAGGALPGQSGLGSVKSQIGHTKCAAGIAGLIKVAKALHHRVLPSTQQIERPNTGYREDGSPFRLQRSALPWLTDSAARAAVSAFGFGGTNFHAVLSAYPQHRVARGASQFPAELFLFRGESPAEAEAVMHRVTRFLEASDAPFGLRDLARSCWESGSGPVQVAFVADDRETLSRRLAKVRERQQGAGIHYRDAAVVGGKVACLFPGQGSQYPGMLRELFVYFSGLHDVLRLDRSCAALVYPPSCDEAGHRLQYECLKRTCNAQPALGLVELAAFRWLQMLGLHPDMAGGHSYGELAALATAGAFGEQSLIDLSHARADAIVASLGDDRGAMAAVGLGCEALRPLLAALPGVAMANRNSPGQTVISGATAAVRAACEALRQRAIEVRFIETECAFHSPLLMGADKRYAAALAGQPLGSLRWPVYSNLTATPHEPDADAIRERLALHIVSPVRFAEQIERMYEDGARLFVEVGPRRVLTGLVRDILRDRPHAAIALDGEERGFAGLLNAAAQLAVSFPGFDADPLFAGRAGLLDLDAPLRLAATTWLVDGGRAVPLNGQTSRHPSSIALSAGAGSRQSATTAVAVPTGASPADHAMLGYLANLREMVRAQRDALVSYLGSDGGVVRHHVAAGSPTGNLPLRETPAVQAAEFPIGDVAAVLLEVISQCTGYPVAHLDADLDLEADLSIDSIKRLEVIGKLAARMGVVAGSAEKDVFIEQLAPLKSLRAMIAWLEARVSIEQPKSSHSAVAGEIAVAAADMAAQSVERYVLRRRDVPSHTDQAVDLRGKQFLITDDGQGLAPYVAALLEAQGATTRIVDFDGPSAVPAGVASIDGFVHLRSLNPTSRATDIKRFFAMVRPSLLRNMGHLLVASGLGGDFGAAGAESNFSRGGGLAGFVKSVVREFPGLRAHWVDLDLSESYEVLAQYIRQELLAANVLSEVAWQAGRRFAREAVPLELTDGSLGALPLTTDSVVLLTGGARGITARIAIALARRYRCQLEIVGRSPLPAAEERSATIGIDDPRELRQALLKEDGARRPAEIERLVQRTLADREFRNTLAQVRAAGGRVHYTSIDVCDTDRFADFIGGLYERSGRIDGVIHGAGVVEDKLVRDKTEESFGRVFDTKVSSALVLNRLIRDDVKFVVFFSSVASAFGNRGQVDYAAANDVLDKLAHSWQARIPGRVVSVNWGPWADTGMVSESLKQEYRRRGIGLISQAQGVEALLRELATGRGDAQVVLMCGKPESFGAEA